MKELKKEKRLSKKLARNQKEEQTGESEDG